jgi:sec-independent protein translocase protein TatC
VPIFTIRLVWTGVVSREDLADKRPYVIVGAFFVGAVLTPPDVVSQTLLSIPIWLLFELGLLFSRLFTRREGARESPAPFPEGHGEDRPSLTRESGDEP